MINQNKRNYQKLKGIRVKTETSYVYNNGNEYVKTSTNNYYNIPQIDIFIINEMNRISVLLKEYSKLRSSKQLNRQRSPYKKSKLDSNSALKQLNNGDIKNKETLYYPSQLNVNAPSFIPDTSNLDYSSNNENKETLYYPSQLNVNAPSFVLDSVYNSLVDCTSVIQ